MAKRIPQQLERENEISGIEKGIHKQFSSGGGSTVNLGFPVKVKKINSNFWPIFYQKPVFVSKVGISKLFIWIHSK